LRATLLAIVAALTVLLVCAAMRPDALRVARSTTIDAPPLRIFAMITDFHHWQHWSPYETKDPDMRRTFRGAGSDQGAVYEWDGDGTVGKGRREVVDTAVPRRVTFNSISSDRSRRTTWSTSRWSRPGARPS
jgi:uncharacterized protein YndB with AHSA1/START domain